MEEPAKQTRQPNRGLEIGKEYVMEDEKQRWFYIGTEKFSRETCHIFISMDSGGIISERMISKTDIIVEGNDKVSKKGESYSTFYHYPVIGFRRYGELEKKLKNLISKRQYKWHLKK